MKIQASRFVLVAAALATGLATTAHAQQEVRIATHVSKASPLYATAQMFSKELSKRFPNAFEFKFYPNGQLGKEKALINNTKLGTMEMVIVASGILKLDDKLGIFDLPWLFEDRTQARAAVEGEFGEAVIQRIEEKQNMVVLGIYESGFRHVINNLRPIRKPEDMEGMKIRVTGSKYKRKGFSLMGADPVPVAWQETFTAIQQGVVDGADASLYAFYGAKLYEITDYISLTSHTYTPSFLIASQSFWNGLTEEQQKGFRQAAKAIRDRVYEHSASLDEKYKKQMRGEVKINEVDVAPFAERAQPVYEEYTSEFGSEWLDMIEAAR